MENLRRKIAMSLILVFSMNAIVCVFLDHASIAQIVSSRVEGSLVAPATFSLFALAANHILVVASVGVICYGLVYRIVLGHLTKLSSRIHVLSHQAEMADTATSVMHNIGNVMTNINVLTSSLSTQLEGSRLPALKKSADLLQDNDDRLGDFLENDSRGKQLPRFLSKLSERLDQEHSELQDTLGSMATGIHHINQILDAQQRLCNDQSDMQLVDLSGLVGDAVQILQASLARSNVHAVVERSDLPPVMLDQGKTLQILINLIANARDAVRNLESSRRQIRVRVSSLVDSHVTIQVIDRGSGITEENLHKVFACGFTTKSDGNGQGLHFCALAAKEMDGSLQVASGGIDKGATFSLSLPWVRAEELVY
ncbi:sensor histidine kinase [Novipirellula herctigrandis]